jgi:hypothetical protein
VWCSFWKPLHVYEGCDIDTKRKIVMLDQGWKFYIINTHKGKSNISLVSTNQAKKMISTSKKNVFLFLRENQRGDESVSVSNISGPGCKSIQVCKLHKKRPSATHKNLILASKQVSGRDYVVDGPDSSIREDRWPAENCRLAELP